MKNQKIVCFAIALILLIASFCSSVYAEPTYTENGQYIFTYEDLAGMGRIELAEGEFVKIDAVESDTQTPSVLLFSTTSTTSTAYYIILQSSGMLLTSPTSGSFSQTRYNAGGTAHTYQKWIFTKDSAGDYIVYSSAYPTKCLTVNPSTKAVTLSTYTGSQYQKWGMYYSSNGNALRSEATDTAVAGYKLVIGSTSCSVSNTAYTPVGFFDVSWYVPLTGLSYSNFHIAPEQSKYVYPTEKPSTATSSNSWLSWTRSNTNISVSSQGKVTGNKTGTATLTFRDKITQVYGSCTVTVTALAEGTYFLKNKQTSCYADIDLANNSIVHQWALHEGYQERWVLKHLGDGYYSIKSARTDIAASYLSVKNDSTALDHPIVIRTAASTSALTDGMKWKFELTSSGAYKIIPKIGESLGYVLVTSTSSATNGEDLLQGKYVSNTSYRDEWVPIRMLPTSGSETAYEPSAWNYAPVIDLTNCYAYALNNQVVPGTNLPWYIQPGETDGLVLDSEDIDAPTVVSYVTKDANNLGFTFRKIGRYETCPVGTYKVALVIDEANDYHWYRQNPNGFWSHKLGDTAVTKYDAVGQLIIDPLLSNRTYSSADYTLFVDYYMVTPLNNFYESSHSLSTSLNQVTLYANISSSNPENYFSQNHD